MVDQSDEVRPDTAGRMARAIAEAGGFEAALGAGLFAKTVRLTLSEALVLGLMRQGVTKYFAVFGHGSTAIAETLRVYEQHGLVRTWQFHNEVEMAHAATALKWIYGETPAVVTSIGPGALQAMVGSLAALSNGIGVYHIYGDETTHGEGYNMQQIPKPEQGLFGRITALMGRSYVLHTPGALREALRQGANSVFHPFKGMPFYLLMPINVQPREVDVCVDALPVRPKTVPSVPADDAVFDEAAAFIAGTPEIVVKAGGGCRRFAAEVRRFAEAAGAAVVLSPGSTGVMPDAHAQNMHVGGTKGSVSGNYAMQNARLLVVIGSRAVCQSDCSGIGYPKVERVININADLNDVQHYNDTLALCGDIGAVLARLTRQLESRPGVGSPARQAWLAGCAGAKRKWSDFKQARFASPALHDDVWQRRVMTQPVAIKTVCDFCTETGSLKIFDAGDVQANGFQIVEDNTPFETLTETGASYMGFAVSALLASAAADRPRHAVAFTGDGSFLMNPQVLVDGIEHGVHATIVVFDNRRMAAITSLQDAQYQVDYRTNDSVVVDYVGLARSVSGVLALDGGDSPATLKAALETARAHGGLSLVHVPVYFGADEIGGMGAYGSWNVGNWCESVETTYANTRI